MTIEEIYLANAIALKAIRDYLESPYFTRYGNLYDKSISVKFDNAGGNVSISDYKITLTIFLERGGQPIRVDLWGNDYSNELKEIFQFVKSMDKI